MTTFQQFNISPWLTPVRLVATSNQSGTYYNGALNNGVGATFTYATGALTIDSVTVNVGDRVLFSGQTSAFQNGIYVCNQAGVTGVAAIFQRAADQQCIEQMHTGFYVTVSAGTTNAGAAFVLVEPKPGAIGTDSIVWTASPLNSGLGTAAAKAASDNTKATLASVSTTTVANELAVFADTAGTVKIATTTSTLGQPLIVSGNVSAGKSATAGVLASFPATATTGSLRLVGVASSGNFNVDISNRSHGQATVYSIADVGAATGSLLNCVVAADPGANLISFDITVGQAALASGAAVTLITSSGSKRYKIRSLQLNSGGTNFSGGGGDRLGQVTDGTTVYSVVPAATMQTLVNAQWGVTALPNPASAAINTSTAAGASLTFKYSGGATDYTAGSLVISGVVERVA